MDILIAFIIFLTSMLASIIWKFSMLIALVVGYFAFAAVALHRNIRAKQIGKATLVGWKKGMVVGKVMLCIGLLTATWRASGTILFFVYYGVKIISPQVFILMSFLLCAILSYALGTSFGVSGTMGYILMTIAAAGGANLVITGGAVLSGVYFGDRCSYASSSAILTAMLTSTTMEKNVPLMLKTGWLPIGLATAAYAVLSFLNPMAGSDNDWLLTSITDNYSISWFTLVPALIMFIMPLFKVPVWITMLVSAFTAFLSAIILQHESITDMLVTCVMGVTEGHGEIGSLLLGGGLVSMLEICGIILVSCSYSEIFEEANMLESVTAKMGAMMNKTGRFAATFIVGAGCCAVFCNQTIADIVATSLMGKAYKEQGGTDQEFAIDIENSLILTAGMVPWCLACKVPLSLIGADISSVPYGFLLYFIPICYYFTKKRYFKESKGKI